MKKVTTLSAAAVLALFGAANAANINEIVMNDASTDDWEFAEICGSPGEPISDLTFLVIEGDAVSTLGNVTAAVALTGPINPSGYWVIGDANVSPDQTLSANWIQNSAQTHLLVRNYNGVTDVDTNNDGVVDAGVGTIVDGIGVMRSGDGDTVYFGVPVLGPDTGDLGADNFDVAGVVRCGDCTGAWGMICFAGTDPGNTGCDTTNPFNPYFVQYASPGSANLCPPVSVEVDTWGKIKSNYR